MVVKQNYRILITWRNVIKNIDKYKHIFNNKKIKFDLIQERQNVKEKTLLKIIHKYDGILCGDDEITKKVIDKAKKLKVISKWGAGMDSIEVEYAKENKIKVFNSPNAFPESVSVYAIGLIIALSRKLLESDRSMRNGKWEKFQGSQLAEKKLGIIGYGRIGRRIAYLAKGFSFDIFVNDINTSLKKNIKKSGFKFLTKKNLFKKVDFLCLAVDLNKKSFHMIGKKEFNLMKKNLILINISRGPVVDQVSLIKALKEKKIAGAGLDVFEYEPLGIKNQLRKMNNCIVSAHNAFNTHEASIQTNNSSIKNLFTGLKI